MPVIKRTTLSILFTMATAAIFAHSIWIETNPTGTAGKSHVVNIYFGEYAQHERDDLSKWRSDLKELELWLIAPNGTREVLKTTNDSNVVRGLFTPQQNGAYTLLVSHALKDLSGTTQLQFLASTHVLVGINTSQIDQSLNDNDLKVFAENKSPWQAKKAITIKVMDTSGPKPDKTVLVFAPSGWSQEFTTSSDGTVTFKPLWPGKYVVEAQNYIELAGEANGNRYNALWQGATYSFDVAK